MRLSTPTALLGTVLGLCAHKLCHIRDSRYSLLAVRRLARTWPTGQKTTVCVASVYKQGRCLPQHAMRDFYGCYLLTSLDPKNKGRTYIGFTVNPRRRIRQHNGEITAGAHKTKRGRPWDMVLVVYGFHTKIQALQFEWAWQHPMESKTVRTIFPRVKKSAIQGTQGKVRLLFEMLNLNPWCYYPLNVQLLSSSYTPLRAKCVPPPAHIAVTTAPMEALPVSVDADFDEGLPDEEAEQTAAPAPAEVARSQLDCSVDAPEVQATATGQGLVDASQDGGPSDDVQQSAASKLCSVCGEKADAKWLICGCGARSHIECTAKRFLQESGQEQGLPKEGTCPSCHHQHTWADLLTNGQSVPWRQNREKQREKQKRRQKKASPKSSPAKRSPGLAKPRAQGKTKSTSEASQSSSIDRPDPPALTAAASTASPVKKPRGRPRKVAGAPATTTADSAASQQLPVTPTGRDADNASPAKRQTPPKPTSLQEGSPAKKARGRPRKVVAAAVVGGDTGGLPKGSASPDPLSGVAAVIKPKQSRKGKAVNASAGFVSHSADMHQPPQFAPQSDQAICTAALQAERQQPGNAEVPLRISPSSTSPSERLSALPLRDRLERIQQLLNQAGCSQADNWQQPSTVQSCDMWQQPTAAQRHDSWQQPTATQRHDSWQQPTAVQRHDSWQQSTAVQRHDSWQQPTAVHSPVSPHPQPASLQNHLGPPQADSWQHCDAVHCLEGHQAPSASLRTPASPQAMPSNNRKGGGNDTICLLSPSPSPSSQQAQAAGSVQEHRQKAEDNPLHPYALCLLASAQSSPAISVHSPDLSELTELFSSVQAELQANPQSELAQLASSVQAEVRNRFSYAEAMDLSSPMVSVLSVSALSQAVLEESAFDEVLHSGLQSGCTEASSQLGFAEVTPEELQHRLPGSVSCCQSPVADHVTGAQQGKKRSRSAPRSSSHRQPAVSSSKRGLDNSRPTDDMLDRSKTAQDTEAGSMEGAVPLNTPFGKSKAISRLAALQVCSPTYASSPVPLRRRLQAQGVPVRAEKAFQSQAVKSGVEVICLDC